MLSEKKTQDQILRNPIIHGRVQEDKSTKETRKNKQEIEKQFK